ncbi:heme peroxidase [Russula brevipes]|nr:heme peroxidase [Russula brevipes]
MSIRAGVDSVVDGLQSAAQRWSASRAPLDTHGAHPVPSLLTRSLEEIKNVVDEGPPFSLSDLPAYIDAVSNLGGTIDDRKYLLEKVLTLMARLSNTSEDILYKDLPHPPGTYLALTPPPSDLAGITSHPGRVPRPLPAQPVSYAYRPADGSNYNPLIPTLGMAGSPYARTVPSLRCITPAALPDPELVFHTLLKRDKFEEHPGGISSLFFAFADLIIHNIFNTDHASGWTVNSASSYLDLSPLYGSSQEAVDGVRKHDGTGKLVEDVFADSRLLYMPPAVCALLIIFNRNHNYVAEKILSINEGGNYKPLPLSDPAAQDEEIFQRARLVNTGYFVQIILRDYVGAILGLARDGSPWRLDPLMSSRDADHDVSPRGQGNVVSVEFNLLYRWHATDLFAKHMKGLDPKTISVEEFLQNARETMNPGKDITKWTFGGLSRHGGRFRDEDLARILQNATAASASAFKARGTPEVLRVVEILGIQQGRAWGTCTLNEFRKFFGLDPLYHDIDNLELYPGAGMCPGFTISRVIISDAIALSRGDRFLTVDYTPRNLTNWGYNDCQANTADGSYGGMLSKLLFRHFPNHYPARSAYAHFPFLVPERMRNYARKLPGDVEPKYIWTRPPVPADTTVVATRYSDVLQLLSEPENFSSGVAERLGILTGGVHLNITPVEDVLTKQAMLEEAAQTILKITKDLISQKKSKGVAPYLDIVRDVINLVPVHWLSDHVIGLPLKTTKNDRGPITEEQLYTWFSNIANYVYCNTDKSNEWFLREQSQHAIRHMEPYLNGHLARLTRGSVNVEGITNSVLRWVTRKNEHSDRFLGALVDASGSQSGNSALDGLAGSVLASVVPTAALFSQIITHDKQERIIELAENRANAQIMPYIFEALLSSVLLNARSPTRFADTGIAQGQHVLASIIEATRDVGVTFENPDTPHCTRPPAHVECVLGLDCRG